MITLQAESKKAVSSIVEVFFQPSILHPGLFTVQDWGNNKTLPIHGTNKIGSVKFC
jgi:hypothetical protein